MDIVAQRGKCVLHCRHPFVEFLARRASASFSRNAAANLPARLHARSGKKGLLPPACCASSPSRSRKRGPVHHASRKPGQTNKAPSSRLDPYASRNSTIRRFRILSLGLKCGGQIEHPRRILLATHERPRPAGPGTLSSEARYTQVTAPFELRYPHTRAHEVRARLWAFRSSERAPRAQEKRRSAAVSRCPPRCFAKLRKLIASKKYPGSVRPLLCLSQIR